MSSGVAPVTVVRRPSCPSSASGDFAETGHGTAVAVRAGVQAGAASVLSGACSMMVCALVPLMPKEETAAQAGAAGLGPLGGLGQQADVALGPVHVGGGPVDVK
ncbi:hypothetical protein SDIAM103S_00317 [Streptomyces diastaticus subsp. diastaticus]